MNNKKYCIQVFAKAPVEGYCKTRLATGIGEIQATLLHSKMINDTLLRICDKQPGNDVQLWCKPDMSHLYFQKMSMEHPIELHEQDGNSLGNIMDNAAHAVFNAGYKACVQIGTDCPDLEQTYIKNALAALNLNDIVIGPANDGGYVLLAQKQYQPGLYNDINWGTSSVLMELIQNLNNLGLSYALLNKMQDIDTADDLSSFSNI